MPQPIILFPPRSLANTIQSYLLLETKSLYPFSPCYQLILFTHLEKVLTPLSCLNLLLQAGMLKGVPTNIDLFGGQASRYN